MLFPVKCLNEQSSRDVVESGSSATTTTSGISPYTWCAGIGGLGFLETTYLTYSKLTGSDAFCPVGGGSCTDILNSNYALVYGTTCFFPSIYMYCWYILQLTHFCHWCLFDLVYVSTQNLTTLVNVINELIELRTAGLRFIN